MYIYIYIRKVPYSWATLPRKSTITESLPRSSKALNSHFNSSQLESNHGSSDPAVNSIAEVFKQRFGNAVVYAVTDQMRSHEISESQVPSKSARHNSAAT